MPSSHLIFCLPFLLLPSIFSSIRVFSNELALHIRWPKYWSFSITISPSSEYSGLISFRIDWFDLLAVQGTLRSLLQCHSLKASVLRCSGFFTVQISHPYMTTGKAIALTIWTFVSKVMSLLFNTLSGFVIVFLPRSKHLLISWLQLLSAVILEPNKIKFVLKKKERKAPQCQAPGSLHEGNSDSVTHLCWLPPFVSILPPLFPVLSRFTLPEKLPAHSLGSLCPWGNLG